MQTSCINFARLPPPKRRSRRQSVGWFALLWILTAAVQSAPSRPEPAPASIILAQGQASPYCIHFSPSAPDSVKLAAAELQSYFAKATGITLPLSAEDAPSGCPVISLGLNQASRAAKLDFAGVPDDGFRVVVNGANVPISSASTDQSATADLIDPEKRTVASLDTYGRLTAQALANRGSRGGYWRLQWKRPWLPHMHNIWVQLDEQLAPWVVVSLPQALEIGAAN